MIDSDLSWKAYSDPLKLLKDLRSVNPIFNRLRDHLQSYCKVSKEDPFFITNLLRLILSEIDDVTDPLFISEFSTVIKRVKELIEGHA
jgi:hypothetical protein